MNRLKVSKVAVHRTLNPGYAITGSDLSKARSGSLKVTTPSEDQDIKPSSVNEIIQFVLHIIYMDKIQRQTHYMGCR